MRISLFCGCCGFLSTLSLRRATSEVSERVPLAEYFYPRSPCGERRANSRTVRQEPHDFYPRSPCGERRHEKIQNAGACLFLSTLSLRRATRCELRWNNRKIISIHALLAESDNVNVDIIVTSCKFLSTLSLRRATVLNLDRWLAGLFLSTLSLRRATYWTRTASKCTIFLSTLSLRRATLGNAVLVSRMWNFYPRSPCGERL